MGDWNFTKGKTGDVREADRAFMSKVNEMVGIGSEAGQQLMRQRERESAVPAYHGNMQARAEQRTFEVDRPTATEASPLVIEFKRMAHNIEVLRQQLERLGVRLSPILHNSNEPTVGQEAIEKAQPASQVCGEVRIHAEAIAQCARQVSTLVDGLTL